MIYGCYIFKGGSGKTTLAGALGTCPALGEDRVLLSLDPQEDLVAAMGMLGDARAVASAAAFRRWLRGETLSDAQMDQVSFELPDKTQLAVNDSALDDLRGDPLVLRRLLHTSDAADIHFVLDLPPRDSTLVAVGLAACDVIVCPVVLDPFGLTGVMRTLLVVQRLVPEPRPLIAVVRNRVRIDQDRAAEKAEKDLVKFCAEHGADGVRLLNAQVRDRSIYRYCASVGRPIWQLTPFHGKDVQADITQLVAELKSLKEERR